MPKIVPKTLPEEKWKKLEANCGYAVRLKPGETVIFRMGPQNGIYLSMVRTQKPGLMVNSVSHETGDTTVTGKIDDQSLVVLGRTSETKIKIMHAIISRRHTQFGLFGNILFVKDLGSTNGSYCLIDNIHFGIDAYIKDHPVDKLSEGTWDKIHEDFGEGLDDFLKNYVQNLRGQS